MEYNHQEIEAKWQKFWADNQTFRTGTDKTKPKFYALDMFPYPSGAGLHVGHLRNLQLKILLTLNVKSIA